MDDIRTYKVHWLNGKTEEMRGRDIAEAFMKAGYGRGAMIAIDYYEEI